MGEDQGWIEASIGAEGLAAQLTARGHHFTTDEPADLGGTDTGPTPYELISAALGACTVMTVRLHATRRGFPLTGATARLKHGRIHAQDCADCLAQSGYIHRIELRLELEGELTGEQRQSLLDAARRCPVHQVLTHEIKVELSLDQ